MTTANYDFTVPTDPPKTISYSENAFFPNKVTKHFMKAVERHLTQDVDVAFDIGSGVAPIAIYLSEKANMVYAVEPSLVNAEQAERNIRKHVLEDRIHFSIGEYFDPLEDLGIKADIITADVSGIARVPSKVLGWYSDKVPCAGEDGTDIICETLRRAPKYCKDSTLVIFPVATDLSAGEKVLETAHQNFNIVENALFDDESETASGPLDPNYCWFPLQDEHIQKINDGYGGKVPDFIKIQKIGRRNFWRGQILYAQNPK